MIRFFRIALIFLFLTGGCAHVRQGSVNKAVEKAYDTNVSITDTNGKVTGAGTIVYNGTGNYMVVLTAAHVVVTYLKKNKTIYALPSYDGIMRRMSVYRLERGYDLAVLVSTRKEHKWGPHARIVTEHPNIGDKVYTVGSPMGDKATLTSGIISNFEYKKKAVRYRFTSPIFFGNSGGGLFNVRMELIGVVTSMYFVRANLFSLIAVPGAGIAASLTSMKKIM